MNSRQIFTKWWSISGVEISLSGVRGFDVQGKGLEQGVRGLGFWVWGLGLGDPGLEFRASDSGFVFALLLLLFFITLKPRVE